MSARRTAPILVTLALMLGATALPETSAASQVIRPNIVFILTDDQRWDTIGRCLNGFDGADLSAGDDACMPHLQRDLVANGMTFLRGYVTTAVCCPSRASALTGLYSRHTGVTHNKAYRDFDESSTIATWLSDSGYRTGFVGKYLNEYGKPDGRTGILPEPHVPPGWDTWHAFWDSNSYLQYSMVEKVGDGDLVVNDYDNAASTTGEACASGNFYQTDLICRRALEFMAADPTAPFMLYLWPSSPHLPAVPPARWNGRHTGVKTPKYPNYDQIPSPNPPKWLRSEPMDEKTHSLIATQFRGQLDLNMAVDDAVHALREQLAADGRLANTVFVFSSDNGFARGEHRHDKKACEYEECHRVPFVVACPATVCPGSQPGAVDSDHMALNIDIPITFTDLAGVTPPFPVDGQSLVPVLNGTASRWRSWFTIEENEPNVAKIDGIVSDEGDRTYKYVEIGNGKQLELYDLTSDPWELTNLAGNQSHADVQSRLAERLRQALVAGPGARTLTASTEGDGSVTSDPAGIDCGSDCWEVFPYGANVTLSVQPAAGSSFAEWGGDCSGTGATCTVAITRETMVTATFTTKGSEPPPPSGTHTLTVTRDGAGRGKVTSSPPGIDCGTDCTENYASGTEVTLSARAPRDSTFGGWSGDCSGTASTCTVTMDSARSVTATFTSGSEPPPPSGTHTLTVTRDGAGRGKVTSSPPGIDCGTDCTENYASGTEVTLSARAPRDSTFGGWSGDCSGTASTCTVTMDTARSVTATFHPV